MPRSPLPYLLFAALLAIPRPGGAAAQEITDGGSVRLVVAEQGNEARYLVREQLAGRDLPNDAIGATSRIAGGITLGADGQPMADGSRIVVDLASLASDADRRDNYLRRRTLDVAAHPVAILVPREIRGLSGPLPETGEARFELVGDLTIRGVTRTVVWDVTARRAGGGVAGRASTRFPFATFELEVPRVGRVLSVDDDIRLEYDFHLVPDRDG